MLGSRAFKTCSVCRDKLRTSQIPLLQLGGPSSTRSISTTPKTGNLDSKSLGNDIDDSVFVSHPLTNPILGRSQNMVSHKEMEGDVDGEEEWTPREERRSPAAVFGSKRIGLEVVPRRMEENIQSEINSMSPLSSVSSVTLSPVPFTPIVCFTCNKYLKLMSDHHPREIREAFLTSLSPSSKQKSKPGRYNDPSKATSAALARAATSLPGDYAVMSNIVRELNMRLGKDWLDGGVVEISSSHGPGIWYVYS
jgi:hypothetical protein